jgi:hypothetical protein
MRKTLVKFTVKWFWVDHLMHRVAIDTVRDGALAELTRSCSEDHEVLPRQKARKLSTEGRRYAQHLDDAAPARIANGYLTDQINENLYEHLKFVTAAIRGQSAAVSFSPVF